MCSYHTLRILCPALLLSSAALAQSPAQQLEQYVDGFTGDFRYSVSLLSVPGPNGEAFPLTANYSAGIGMNQEASWIGLGWSLSVGEVTRSLKGVPDDWKAGKVDQLGYINLSGGLVPLPDELEFLDVFGPVHFKELNGHTPTGSRKKRMDLYVSRHGMTGATPSFEFPDYDDFHVSGPGIGGVMQPYMFDYSDLYKADTDDVTYGMTKSFHRRPVFRFRNEQGATIHAPYYGRYNTVNTLPSASQPDNVLLTPHALRPGPGETYNAPFPSSDTLHFMTAYSSNCEEDPYVLWASNHIEYFTNEELSVGVAGFMEFTSGVDRSSVDFEQDGIGAFRITSPSGLVYHYSLPVYVSDEVMKDFLLDSDDDFAVVVNDPENPVMLTQKMDRYASGWKLTGVTGPDYVDVNDNGLIDDGDRGYWIAVDYGKWTGGFGWRSPFYGYNFDQRVKENLFNWTEENYHPRGTVTLGSNELYYPKRIRTATHAAYFVYAPRLDGHSVPNSSDVVTPKLNLSRIVLMNRDHDTYFSTLTPMTSTDFPNLSSVANVTALVSETHYVANKTAIEKVSLGTVEFNYDYSLAKGVYNNIRSELGIGTEVTIVTSATPLENNSLFWPITSYDTDPHEASGKLTLKSIATFGDRHGSYAPDIKFEYATGSHNPDFDHRRKDHFGYFKKNFDSPESGYITSQYDEDEHLDAWSMKRIITPIGAEIGIEYESDVYNEVCYDAGTNGIRVKPNRIFRFSEADKAGSTEPWTFKLFDSDGYYYLNSGQWINWGLGFNTYCYGPGQPSQCEFMVANSDLPNFTYNSTLGQFESSSAIPGCSCTMSIYEERPNKGWGYIRYNLKEAFGGGVRVKEISITDPDLGQEYALRYTYAEGVLTTEPDKFTGVSTNAYTTTLRFSTHGSDRHARPPSVGYGKVFHEIIGDNEGRLGRIGRFYENHHNDLRPIHLSNLVIGETGPGVESNSLLYNYVFLRDHSISGRMMEHLAFDGKDVVVSRTKYSYSDLVLDNHGGTDEVFYSGSSPVITNDPNFVEFRTVFRKLQIQRYLKRTVHHIDDKVVTSEVNERDPLTGTPTVMRTVSLSDGTEISKTVFAYHGTPGMGSKYLDPSARNMVGSVGGRYVYSEEQTDNHIKDASVAEWDNDFDHWHWDEENDRFVRNTGFDKYAVSEVKAYNGESDEEQWKTMSTTTLMDSDGNVVEQRSADGKFNSMKFGYDAQHVVVRLSKSNFQGGTHTSFEDLHQPEAEGDEYFEGYVLKTGSIVMASTNTMRAHAGNYFAMVDGSGPSFSIEVDDDNDIARGLEPGRTYTASVWVHRKSAAGTGLRLELDGKWDGSGQTMTETMMNSDGGLLLGDWKRLNVTLTVPEDYVPTDGLNGNNNLRVIIFSLGGSNRVGYFDDLRVHPVDATIEAMVYDHRTGRMTFSLDNDNIATKYEYDAAGNVVRVFSEREQGLVKQLETSVRFGREN